MEGKPQPIKYLRRSTRDNFLHISKYLDEDGILHMCKKCRFVLVTGDPSNKIMIAKYFYSNPPEDTNFVVCLECS